MTLRLALSVATVCMLLTACATTHDKYAWGSYEHSLYVYYKDPATAGALSAHLEAIIANSDRTKAVVAPGVYAEYGYLLLKQGKSQAAASAFQQEEQHWPESKVFMDMMIHVAESRPASTVSER